MEQRLGRDLRSGNPEDIVSFPGFEVVFLHGVPGFLLRDLLFKSYHIEATCTGDILEHPPVRDVHVPVVFGCKGG